MAVRYVVDCWRSIILISENNNEFSSEFYYYKNEVGIMSERKK